MAKWCFAHCAGTRFLSISYRFKMFSVSGLQKRSFMQRASYNRVVGWGAARIALWCVVLLAVLSSLCYPPVSV